MFQQQQQQQQMQELQFKEQAKNMSFVTSSCFRTCINNFDNDEIASTELECLKKCQAKMMKTFEKVSEAFQAHQDIWAGKN